MPSTSPGKAPSGTPTDFVQVLPGKPASSLQAITTFLFRHRRYIAYISGHQLSFLASPTNVVQTLTFREELVALASDSLTGKLAVAGKTEIHILEPVTEGWKKIWWEKALSLRREDAGDEARCLDWGNEGEVLVGGSHQLTLFSTLQSSRTSSPATSPIDGEAAEDRKALWSKQVASPLQYAGFSPSVSLIATCGVYDRLVKIWRRLSFEEGLFDYTYLSHPGTVTHAEWRPQEQHVEERRGSGISGRHEEDSEVLFTMASDGILRVWKTGSIHDLDILLLHTTVDLVSAIPRSPSFSVKNRANASRPSRYAFILSAGTFGAAVTAALAHPVNGGVSHSLEHLKEVVSTSPDVIIIVDGAGRMSAWGLQSIGHKRRPETPGSNAPFHIAHTEGLPLQSASPGNARFVTWFDNEKLQLLAHELGGDVRWWQGDVETFFSTAASGSERLLEVAVLSGHDCEISLFDERKDAIGFISQDTSGKAMSWSRDSNGLIRLDHAAQSSRRASGEQDRLTNGTALSQLVPSSRSSQTTSLAVSIDESGVISKQPSTSKECTADGKNTSTTIETGLRNPGLFEANAEIAAIASTDGHEVIIVDLQDGYIEHRQQMTSVPVRHLRCFAFAPGHNLVAVGYRDHVEVLAQGTYRHRPGTSTWQMVKSISVAGTGLAIGGMVWLRDGALALAAGNGILLSSNIVSAEQLGEELSKTISLAASPHTRLAVPQLSAQLKKPLPTWHPRVLLHMVYHGKERAAYNLLHKLAAKLKFWSEGDDLHALLDVQEVSMLDPTSNVPQSNFNEDLVKDLQQQLDEKDLPSVSGAEQKHLMKIIEALSYLSQHKDGLDQCALRYLFSWRLQSLDSELQTNGATHPDHLPVPEMQWREIALVSNSTTQQPLLDILLLHYDKKLTWSIARRLGITAWLSDPEALAQVFESLAQSAYRQSSPPDPTNAALYFLALHKKPTLLALWRIATGHQEQRATVNFLKRDFTQPDARTAAKKNAYALMGKRRFEYAAAFFLLADAATSATSLLAGQCDDIMLAIAVARLYDGDGSPALQELLGDRLMPKAEKEGDRWLMSWCHSLLLQKSDAAHVLVKPSAGVRYWHQDDPTTLMLYRRLRKGGSEQEYEAVLRSARILRKMGLWLLALELVARWDFPTWKPSPPVDSAPATANGAAAADVEPPSMLNGFSPPSPPPASQPPSMLNNFAANATPQVTDEKAAREAKAAELLKKLKAKKEGPTSAVVDEKKPQPTQFKEPDANSLLDSFGF